MNGQGNKSDLFNDLLIRSLFNAFIGKCFCNNEDRYEGEWKDGKMHGKGNKSDLFNGLLILSLFNAFIGENSGIMGTDMKESGKMTQCTVKVRKVIYLMIY